MIIYDTVRWSVFYVLIAMNSKYAFLLILTGINGKFIINMLSPETVTALSVFSNNENVGEA